ncbi:lactosylceramide 4-alpha-galactosyltransferase [Eurytemora carolleeae]|uniref:lactosylceramide 4-alpha-galactosyltransferase n=1 Tax=Eurytemora carolleeae TaxID=1294199 RepID=UPI000C7762F6|nr:lactosylceramide 4-alpha-galactosyltransferase [Eurytemora carolleeae]|eukprot:XP_023323266.1 lactosylceramide 4-alpha-galactosyltransferase-like [Eurytemora affinis]
MVRFGKYLDLSDNTTCQAVNRFENKMEIYHLDFSELAKGTAMEGFFTSSVMKNSDYRYTHMADGLRLLLVYKFGGFYADTDYVIIRSLKDLKNVVASDQVNEEKYNDEGQLLQGHKISNAMFHFEKGHRVLECAINNFFVNYQPHSWAANGPDLLNRCLMLICGLETARETDMTVEKISRDRCEGAQLLDHRSFYPFPWIQFGNLYDPKQTKKDWKNVFKNSYGVHFYHGSTKTKDGGGYQIWKPSNYGARKPAYLALALEHCPVSFDSRTPF